MTAPAIEIHGDRLSVHFTRFDLEEYPVFLRCKKLPESAVEYLEADQSYRITAPARFADLLGIERPSAAVGDLPFADFLFDDQRFVLKRFLEEKRFACWAGCGLGKTPIGLEAARQVIHRTAGRVLIFTRNEIVGQWIDESKKFYGDALPIVRLESREAMKDWCLNGESGIAITNYEKLNYASEGPEGQVITEFQSLAMVALDEGDRLRTQGGKQKWALIKSCEQIEYKLILTATPAPNDIFEFASQAGFLNKFTSEDSINTYFSRDHTTHRWTVKPHARKAFFDFMSTWSIYVNNPKRFGWRLNVPEVPEPIVMVHDIEPTEAQRVHIRKATVDQETGQASMMLDKDLNAIERMKLSQVAKGFRYTKGEAAGKFEPIESKKPKFVADLIRSEINAGHRVLVWTVFDAESEILCKALGKRVKFDRLHGKTKDKDRLPILERFRRGESDCLISLGSMLGYGMNFQFCTSMIFSGWSDSFVTYYQSVRRAYRFGQTEKLRVHIPCIEELEGDQLKNIFRKENEFLRGIEEMEDNYIRAYRDVLGVAA